MKFTIFVEDHSGVVFRGFPMVPETPFCNVLVGLQQEYQTIPYSLAAQYTDIMGAGQYRYNVIRNFLKSGSTC